ncbi:Golgi transport complex subunit 6 [Orbilia brochopaga]|uniref:Conserved oligomeric Golgi complex subunit 6 n=1 Tax=Orbilia brochopaga TaxID=3140254 RepID=A0AAV9UIJ9_9PEZI
MTTPDILLPLEDRNEQYSTEDAQLQENPGLKSNHLPVKASQILSTSVTDPDIKEGLSAFISIVGSNNADNRRQLRAQMLQELASSSSQVVQDFGLIALQVGYIGDTLELLHETFADIATRSDRGEADIRTTLQERDTLLLERLRVRRREALLHAFLEKFTLPVADLAKLTSASQALEDDFFDTLIRVKAIYSDCQVLLGSESTRAGVEIMDQMTKNLNSAYQRVYLWLQRELKFVSFESPVGNHRVRKALDVLTSRPGLFQSCMDTLAESRQQTLTDAFNMALTGGERGMDTKPIDMMAHDPIRYIGDMLAWLHSTLVSELEALQAIFELPPASKPRGTTHMPELEAVIDDTLNVRDHMRPLVDKSLETVLSVLRFRTEQVISSHEEPTLLYGLLNILTFYRETFKKAMGPETLVISAMDSLVSAATRQLQSCLRDLVRAVQHDIPTTTMDLSPPVFLLEALSRFKDLDKKFEASLISESYKPIAFDMIYSEALQPYIQGCQTLSTDLASPKSHIFMVNCLEVSKNTLRLSPYGAKHYLHLLEDIVDEHIASIIFYLHEHFLEMSGLSRFISTKDDKDIKLLLDSASLTQDTITECALQLDEFLPVAISDAEVQLSHLSRPSLRKTIVRHALDQFVKDFASFEALLLELPPTIFSRELFPRTTREIQILLG